MLPTFPKIERFSREVLLRHIEALAAQYSPLLGKIQKHIQFEGEHAKILRHDKSVGDTPFNRISIEIRFERESIKDFMEVQLPKKLDELARQLAKDASTAMYARLEEGIDSVGNVVNAKGQPLNEKLLLELLDKMEHTFSADGTWKPPTLFAHPDALKGLVQNKEAGMAGSDDFNQSLEKILEKKRNEFRRREADRILAG